jgi:hypothetical protein
MAGILVATSSGLQNLAADGRSQAHDLAGHRVRSIAPETWAKLWAIVDSDEIWHTGDDGAWRRVASLGDLAGADGLEAHCLADTRANPLGGILIGTSNARLVRVTEQHELHFVESFERSAGRDEWYTPWGGPPDTRTISEDSNTVFVNVHVGGILRSRDEGASWEPTIDIHEDVHQVTTGQGRVYAAGGRGLAISDDGGDSWRIRSDGLDSSYCRAVAVCGESVLLSASTGPRGGRAALYRSDLDGARFERCRDGLPEWFEDNLDSLCVDALPNGGLAAFGTKDGEVYASTDQGMSWRHIAGGLGFVERVLVVP